MKLVLTEAESGALREFVSNIEEPVSSILSRVEVPRAVRRTVPVPERVSEVLAPVQLIEIDEAILGQAARLDPPELRTADAIHLASALRLGTVVSSFVTYDRRLRDAAVRAGLAVESPA